MNRKIIFSLWAFSFLKVADLCWNLTYFTVWFSTPSESLSLSQSNKKVFYFLRRLTVCLVSSSAQPACLQHSMSVRANVKSQTCLSFCKTNHQPRPSLLCLQQSSPVSLSFLAYQYFDMLPVYEDFVICHVFYH